MARSIRVQAQNLLTQLEAMKEAKDLTPMSSIVLIELALREAESMSLNMIAYLDEEAQQQEFEFPAQRTGIKKLWHKFRDKRDSRRTETPVVLN